MMPTLFPGRGSAPRADRPACSCRCRARPLTPRDRRGRCAERVRGAVPRRRLVVFDGGDGARQGANVARANLIGPGFEMRTWRRRKSTKRTARRIILRQRETRKLSQQQRRRTAKRNHFAGSAGPILQVELEFGVRDRSAAGRSKIRRDSVGRCPSLRVQDLPRDHHALDFAGAFADGAELANRDKTFRPDNP